jgi:hypothetical protein
MKELCARLAQFLAAAMLEIPGKNVLWRIGFHGLFSRVANLKSEFQT